MIDFRTSLEHKRRARQFSRRARDVFDIP